MIQKCPQILVEKVSLGEFIPNDIGCKKLANDLINARKENEKFKNALNKLKELKCNHPDGTEKFSAFDMQFFIRQIIKKATEE